MKRHSEIRERESSVSIPPTICWRISRLDKLQAANITTRNPSDALLFIRVARPQVLICGPGVQANEPAMRGFTEINKKVQLLLLPSDFSTAEAGQAGIDLVNRIQVFLSGQQ